MKLVEQYKVDSYLLRGRPGLSQWAPRHAVAIAMKSIVENENTDVRAQCDLREPIIEKNKIGPWVGF
jgi:hypothetical protein